MATVRAWAAAAGYDYAFLDDCFLDFVPAWFTKRVAGNMLLVSDLARLEAAREFLSQNYERAIWVDADVLVFDSERFAIEVTEGCLFCREVWVYRVPWRRAARLSLKARRLVRFACAHKVNNAVSVFTRGNSFLGFYIYACKSIIKNKPVPISSLEIGTGFLTALHTTLPLPLLRDVGAFSPLLMHDLAAGGKVITKFYAAQTQTPLRAANLCSSLCGLPRGKLTMTEQLYEVVLDRLLDTRGAIINDLLPAHTQPTY